MRWFMISCTTLLLSACNNLAFRPAMHPNIPTDGTPLYQQGFKEGCNTGMTIYGNDVVRMQYSTQVTPELMQQKTYKNAWKLGNRYCRFHVSQVQMEGWFIKDFGIPVLPSRKLPNETSVFRERLTDSFWMAPESDGSIFFEGWDWRWSSIDRGTSDIGQGEDLLGFLQ